MRDSASEAYLQTIVHRVALCDRCIQRIVGEWFHCAYCAKDLCDACEAMDSHDASHLFVVFKSVVDMTILRYVDLPCEKVTIDICSGH